MRQKDWENQTYKLDGSLGDSFLLVGDIEKSLQEVLKGCVFVKVIIGWTLELYYHRAN